MKKLFVAFGFVMFAMYVSGALWVRVNQLGYLPEDVKVAVCLCDELTENPVVELRSALTAQKVDCPISVEPCGEFYQFKSTFRIRFSDFKGNGNYFLVVNDTPSPFFRIADDVYDGTADFLLNYMRQQRCGYNPSLDQTCHQHDGFEVRGVPDSLPCRKVDVRGGWHDASDYLQYTTTSANAIYQMLFAYKNNPTAFADNYDAAGRKGANGIPDILDEAKWGLDWLDKMNPEPEVYYNQIADDRDHASFRFPSEDFVDYGWGEGTGRPVYLVSDEPQGLMKYRNRSNGKASTVGKFASSFSLGAQLLSPYYPDFAERIGQKAKEAFAYASRYPGVSQTAPGKSPYFYEEDNWTDDMELAAVTLFKQTNDNDYWKKAVAFGRMEPLTPWMGSDTANHYQWYPFVNLGHFSILSEASASSKVKKEFAMNTRNAIERVSARAAENPFRMGVPFIWCSNNLVTAMATHCHLYRTLTGDMQFVEMETALRDWLFGCNPWGTSMVVGLPAYGDYPVDPHSALWVNYKIPVNGGLVDGPVYGAIYNGLIGVRLSEPDEYAHFQSDWAVYHDDWGDYSSNEPTMDGTASLTYYLSAMAKRSTPDKNVYSRGGIIKTDPDKKRISLIFSGHEFADGYPTISKVLKKRKIKAAFFFTGDFYRNTAHHKMIKKLIADGHYVGAHSDQHLLYAAWEKQDSTLVSRETFVADIRANYREIQKFKSDISDVNLFLPAFEYYNDSIAALAKSLGLQVVNYTPGTRTNGDYTVPQMDNYYSSDFLFKSVMAEEQKNGLNGNIMLMHIGTDARRTDKFYNYLDKLIVALQRKGYQFVNLPEAIK